MEKLPEKGYQYLAHLFDTSTTYDIHEFLIHSEIFIEENQFHNSNDAYKMEIKTDPEIYKKYQGYVNRFSESIAGKLEAFSGLWITDLKVFPDLSKFQILNNRITPILTPWEKINIGQNNLITGVFNESPYRFILDGKELKSKIAKLADCYN